MSWKYEEVMLSFLAFAQGHTLKSAFLPEAKQFFKSSLAYQPASQICSYA